MRLSDICISRPVFATVLSLVLVLLGIVAYQRLAIREYPNIDAAVVTVATTYRGADAQIVESQVTKVLEDSLAGIEGKAWLELLYWLDRSRRDLLTQRPRGSDGPRGTFSLRSPQRPNPIGSSMVRLLRREGAVLMVRGLDCLDGTPLLDLKPARCDQGVAQPAESEPRK